MNVKSIATTYCPHFLRPLFNRIDNSTIGSRLARGMFWSMTGTMFSKGLMLCATILVARILGKTVYGEMGMIQTTVAMFGVFAGFGIGLTATKYVAEFRKKDPERAGRIIGLSWIIAAVTGSLMTLGLYIFAPWLAEHTLNSPHTADLLRIGSLILFVNTLNGAQTGALSGFEAFKTIAHVNIFVGLISFPILVAGAYFGDITGAVWALAINLSIDWLLNHLALRKEARRYQVPLTFQHCQRELPILWKFSLPAVLAGSMTGPVTWACSALLVNRPDGYSEMGIFSATNQWFAVLLFFPTILGNVILPLLSDQMSLNNNKQSLKTMVLAIKVNLLIVMPLVIAVSIASPYIMNLYGESFSKGWPTLIVILWTAGLLAIQQPVGQIIAASGQMWIGFAMNTGWAIVFIVSTLHMVKYGAIGLASARILSYVVHATWTFGFAIWLILKGVNN